MAIKTPGSLGLLQFIAEKEYGTIKFPATAKGLGFMRSANADQSRESTDVGGDGSRKTVTAVDGVREATLSCELTLYKKSENMDWSVLIQRATEEETTAATLLMKIAKDEYFLLTGAMIDKITLSADAPGSMILAKIDFKGQKLMGPEEKVSDFGEITEVGEYSNIPIIFNSYPRIIYEDGTEEIIPTHKFSYTFSNALVPQEGILDDGVPYKAGNGIVPGTNTCSLEFEVTSKDNIWDTRKINGFRVKEIRHLIDGMVISFKNCELLSGLPARSQSVYNETITFKVHSDVTIE